MSEAPENAPAVDDDATRCQIDYQLPINVVVLDIEAMGIGDRVASDFQTANQVLRPAKIHVYIARRKILTQAESLDIVDSNPDQTCRDFRRTWESNPAGASGALRRSVISLDLTSDDLDRGISPTQRRIDSAARADRTTFRSGTPTGEMRALFRKGRSPGRLTGYWIPYLGGGQFGLGIASPAWNTVSLGLREGMIIASAECAETADTTTNTYVFVHELVHVLTKCGHTDLAGNIGNAVPSSNLMRNPPLGSELTQQQRDRIRDSRYLRRVRGRGRN